MEPSPGICCLKASYTVKWYVIISITPWRPPSQALTLKHQVTSAKSMMAWGLKPYGGYWSYYSKCYMNCIQGKAAHFMQRGTFREVDSHTNQRDDLTVCDVSNAAAKSSPHMENDLYQWAISVGKWFIHTHIASYDCVVFFGTWKQRLQQLYTGAAGLLHEGENTTVVVVVLLFICVYWQLENQL